MNVYIVGNTLSFEASQGEDSDRALLLGSLLLSPDEERSLQHEYLGHGLHDDGRPPVSDQDALVVLDTARLITHVHKNRERTPDEFVLGLAEDIAPGAAVNLFKRAGFRPVDAQGLPHTWKLR